jgi:hypothetical protein
MASATCTPPIVIRLVACGNVMAEAIEWLKQLCTQEKGEEKESQCLQQTGCTAGSSGGIGGTSSALGSALAAHASGSSDGTSDGLLSCDL